MRLNFDQLKTQAGISFKRRFGVAFAASILPSLVMIISMMTMIPAVISNAQGLELFIASPRFSQLLNLYTLLLLPFSLIAQIGLAKIFLALRRQEETSIGEILWGFYDFRRSFMVTLPLLGIQVISQIISILQSYVSENVLLSFVLMLASIAAMVGSIAFWMLPYLAAEDIDKAPQELWEKALSLSAGRRWDYIVYSFSFIGWFFLVGITGGLVGIYVLPYFEAAITEFYCAVREEKEGIDIDIYLHE